MMLDSEQSVFLTSLSDFIQKKKTPEPNKSLDYLKLLKIAEKHDCAQILYAQLKDYLPADVRDKYHSIFKTAVYLSVMREKYYVSFEKMMFEAGIDFTPIKGRLISKCYPVYELRTMGDIDILVDKKDLERVGDILTANGYKTSIDNPNVYTYYFGPVFFEVHSRLFYEKLRNGFDYSAYFDNIKKFSSNIDGTRYDVYPSYHLVYLIAHAAKHIVNKGIGFRAYLDVAAVCMQNNIDIDFVKGELNKIGLYDFGMIFFGLCEKWFGIKTGFIDSEIDENLLQMMTESTFNCGLFGNRKTANAGVYSKISGKTKGADYLKVFSLSIKRMFPSYDNMWYVPQYSFIKGKPWLLPIAWIYRWIYCLINKKRPTSDIATAIKLKEEIESRNDFLNSIGL